VASSIKEVLAAARQVVLCSISSSAMTIGGWVMRGAIFGPTIFLLVFSVSVLAAETRRSQPDVAPPPAAIADLAWLAGQWDGEGAGGAAQEVYSVPLGGQIIGHFRQSKSGKIQFYEIVAIAEAEGSLEYRVKHFNADLTGWEEKAEVQKFPLVAIAQDVWYFDGLTIRRDGPDGMITTVLATMKDGAKSELAFRYRRIK